MNRSRPIKASEMINTLVGELEALRLDASKFDKGNDSAGQRLRKSLNIIRDMIEHHRKEIQRTRYYREAWDVFFGRKNYIDGLDYKEKTYGTIGDVAQLQYQGKWKA